MQTIVLGCAVILGEVSHGECKSYSLIPGTQRKESPTQSEAQDSSILKNLVKLLGDGRADQ